MLRITTIIGFIACAMLWQTAAAVAGVCDRFDELITTTPAPPQSALLWKLYAQELANARQVNYDLVLLGDSLAHGWPDNRLSPLQVANFGVGGDRTQHVLWRLAAPELTKLQPRKILIIYYRNQQSICGKSPLCDNFWDWNCSQKYPKDLAGCSGWFFRNPAARAWFPLQKRLANGN